jgi:biopolymer transport protein ExbD
MKIDLAPRPRHRMNLTPMIDVVFLLLVFFMMVSRFGAEQAVPLQLGGTGGNWTGPPRLVDISDSGVRLNGSVVPDAVLVQALEPLMASPQDPVILRLSEGSDVQDLMEVMDRLQAAGMTRLSVVP